MTISAIDYANLSNRVYQTPQVDVTRSNQKGYTVYQDIQLGGIKYTPIEHIDNPTTGYQGTIYQRQDTGEIVVAHRGTGANSSDILADASMVFKRINPQVLDAETLTRKALLIAQDAARTGNPIPTVTITGHSLGGTLAQITAHEFGLQAQTFNPYGAVSLQYGVPAREPHIINHVMAADPVSAASPQPGQTFMYATQTEVRTVMIATQTTPELPTRRPVIAALASLGSHGIANFSTVDDQGRPKPSVLTDPLARQRAADYAEMFALYRNDAQMIRGGLSVTGAGISQAFHSAAQASSRAKEALHNGLHHFGMGAPGSNLHAQRFPATPMPTATMPMTASGAPHYARPLDPRDPHHPDHAMYQHVREKLQTLNDSGGIKLSPTQMENGVAAIMADARANRMTDVNTMVFGEDHKTGQTLKHRVVTVQGRTPDPWDDMLRKIGSTDMRQAINVPAQQSYERFEQATQQEQARQQALAQQLAAQTQSHDGPKMRR